MILFDAVHVNRSGGEVLLDVLIDALRPHQEGIHFLLDDRLTGKFDAHGLAHVIYLKASVLQRHRFYSKNQHHYNRIFCFSGIPPTKKTDGECLAYLQNSLLIEHPGWSHSAALKRSLQNLFMRVFGGHVNGWIVQTEHMRRIATNFFRLGPTDISVLPFFKDPLGFSERVSHNGFHLLYTSEGYPHKNHRRLFDAFETAWLTRPDLVLHVTLSDRFGDLKSYVVELNARGLPIVDHGFVSHAQLISLYASMDAQVFPSLTESLGIGLIESAQAGLPVIAANRHYVIELIKPTATFDPLDLESIRAALIAVAAKPAKPAQLRIRSHLGDLVERIVAPIE
jgi:glycosyltransferase involved in cell wall biosynthesis